MVPVECNWSSTISQLVNFFMQEMDVNMNLMDKEAIAAAAASQIPSLELSHQEKRDESTGESPQYTQLLLKFNVPGSQLLLFFSTCNKHT